MNKCTVCGKPIENHESAVALDVEAGFLKTFAHFALRDKHILCSPSRAQHIVHPDFPPVVDDRETFNKWLWSEEERQKYQTRYTNAWLRLQQFKTKD